MKFNDDNSFDITIIRGVSNLVINRVFASWNEAEQQIIVEIENHQIKSRVFLEKNSHKIVIFDDVSNKH